MWARRLIMTGTLVLGVTTASNAQVRPRLADIFGYKSNDPDVTVTRMEGGARQVEQLIEIAWMADPLTCSHNLEARVNGQALLIRGYVPNAAAHRQALAIAKLFSSLAVVDTLHEQTYIAATNKKVASGQIEHALAHTLNQSFADWSGGWNVDCGADGRVSVSGAVPSLDMKHAVGKAIRRIPGVTSINNQLAVRDTAIPRPAPQVAKMPQQRNVSDGGARVVVNANGTTQMPGQQMPIQHAMAVPSKMPQPNMAPKVPMRVKPAVKSAPEWVMQQSAAGWPIVPVQAIVQPAEQVKQAPVIQPAIVVEPLMPTSMPVQPEVQQIAYSSPQQTIIQVDTADFPAPVAASVPPSPVIHERTKAAGYVTVVTERSATAVDPERIRRKIEEIVPGVKDVVVMLSTNRRAQVELRVRPREDTEAVAQRILALPELQPFLVDLQIRVPE